MVPEAWIALQIISTTFIHILSLYVIEARLLSGNQIIYTSAASHHNAVYNYRAELHDPGTARIARSDLFRDLYTRLIGLQTRRSKHCNALLNHENVIFVQNQHSIHQHRFLVELAFSICMMCVKKMYTLLSNNY